MSSITKTAMHPPGAAAGRAFITGVDGFTGRYLEAVLVAAGWEVFGTGMSPVPAGKGRYRQINLNDQAQMTAWVHEVRPHAVVHLAGIAFVGHGIADSFYAVNLVGTRHLLEALASLPQTPNCVLLASSANVYGNSASGTIDESQPVAPANDYAVSKLAMEFMARLWLDRLPIVIARPFNYTGVGQSEAFFFPKIVSHFRRGADCIELGNLDVWRDFSDVRTIAHVYHRILSCQPPRGTTLNVCSGRLHSLREILSMAESITGHPMAVEVNPAFVRTNEVRSLCGNPALLVSLIGDYDSISLEETLRWMLAA